MMPEPVSPDFAPMAVAANLLPDASGLAPLSLPEDILRDAPRPRTPPSPEAIRRFEAAMAGLPEGETAPDGTGRENLRAAVSLFRSVALRDLPGDGSPAPAIPERVPAADVPKTPPVPADRPAAFFAAPALPSVPPAVAEKPASAVAGHPVVTAIVPERPATPERAASVLAPKVSPVLPDKPVPAEEPVPPAAVPVATNETPAATAAPVVRPAERTPGDLATDGRPTAIEPPAEESRRPDAPAAPSVTTPSAPAAPKAGTPLRGTESAAPRPEMPARTAKTSDVAAPDAPEKPETVLQAAPVAVDAPAAPASPAPAASEAVAAAASARTEAVAETVERIAAAVASHITFTPSPVQGEGEVKITLAPTVLDGSGIALSAQDGTLSVTIVPATAEAAQTAAAALPRLEAALAAHAPAFQRIAVSLAAKKGTSDETV